MSFPPKLYHLSAKEYIRATQDIPLHGMQSRRLHVNNNQVLESNCRLKMRQTADSKRVKLPIGY